MNLLDNIPSPIDVIRNTMVTGKSLAGTSSIVDVPQLARVEPITLVSSSLRQTPELWDILQGLTNVYAAYYLQSVNLLSAGIANVKIFQVLDSINPNRTLNTLMSSIGKEYLTHNIVKRQTPLQKAENARRFIGLEGLEYGVRSKKFTSMGLEATTPEERSEFAHDRAVIRADREDKAYDGSRERGRAKLMNDFDKYEQAVGKVIEVSVNLPNSSEQVTITTVVKLNTMIVPSDVLSDVVTFNEGSIRFGARFKQALTGEIHPIMDFLFASDLIKKQKRNLMNDPSQATKAILDRNSAAKVYGLVSKNPSLNAVSSIMVISDEEERVIRAEIGGDLSNPKTRQIVFDNSMTAIIAVVYRDYGEVSLYIRGTDNVVTLPFSRFKGKSGSNDTVITDILASLQTGRALTF